MSSTAKQAIVLAFGGLVMMALLVRLSRRRLITPRYAFGWIGVAGLIVVGASLMPFVGRIGKTVDMSPTGVLLAMSTALLVAITVQLSISVSQLQERLRSTAEAQALLARRLDELTHSEH
jgi:hypothetical protein